MKKTVKKKGSAISVLSREEYLRQLAASEEPLTIKLTNNFAFRKIFKNKKVAKGFLIALLKLTEEEILEIEIMDPYEEGECAEEKEGILDVKIHLNNGKKINLEMQNRYQEDWSERSLFYNCRMFVEGYEHGIAYGDMEPCIHVGILNFNQMTSPGFHHRIILQDVKTGECYSSKFEFHVIQLKKLEETPESERDELYRWARLIAADDWASISAEVRGNPYMEEVEEEMMKISQDEMQRYLYLRESMAYTDEVSRMRTARNEGLREGRQEGRQEGIRNMVESFYELGITKETAGLKLEEKFGLSQEEAKQAVEKYWK